MDRRAALVAIAALGAYAVYDASIYYPAPAQRIFYALAVLPLLVGGAAALLLRTRLAPGPRIAVLALTALAVLPLVSSLVRGEAGMLHIAGDLATLLVPLAGVLYFAAVPDSLRRGAGPVLLLGLLGAGALVAPLLGRNHADRFEPPQILLVAVAVTVFIHRGRRAKLVAGGVLFCLVALILGSGLRTVLLSTVAVAGAGALMLHGWKRAALGAGILAVLVALLLLITPQETVISIAGKYRFDDMARGKFDSSLLARINEGRDIAVETREWGPLEWAIGAGHGATWHPNKALEVPGTERSFLADGSIHQLHAVPVALFYRCGLLGAAAWLLFAYHASAPFFRRQPAVPPSEAVTLYRLALVGYLMMSLTTAIMVQPLLALTLAGSLVVRDETAVEKAPSESEARASAA